jgi:uncharacterized membrane protein YphA (DoxX/SURF4 family)
LFLAILVVTTSSADAGEVVPDVAFSFASGCREDELGLIIIAARWLIAALFLRSGLAKVSDIGAFRSAVRNYQILPPGLVGIAVVALPVAEITAGILLAAGVITSVVAAAVAALLLAFAAAIAVNLARGRVFDCGCMGSAVAPSAISWRHVIYDLVLAAISVSMVIDMPRMAQAWPWLSSPVHSAVRASDLAPLVLIVALALIATMLLRRALTLRALAGSAARHLGVTSARNRP